MLLMGLAIRIRGVRDEDDVEAKIERSLRFALGRYGRQIERVVVRVDDLNGPRGGVDKQVKVQVTGPGIGVLVVEERHAELGAAVDRAASKADRAISRWLARARLEARPSLR